MGEREKSAHCIWSSPWLYSSLFVEFIWVYRPVWQSTPQVRANGACITIYVTPFDSSTGMGPCGPHAMGYLSSHKLAHCGLHPFMFAPWNSWVSHPPYNHMSRTPETSSFCNSFVIVDFIEFISYQIFMRIHIYAIAFISISITNSQINPYLPQNYSCHQRVPIINILLSCQSRCNRAKWRRARWRCQWRVPIDGLKHFIWTTASGLSWTDRSLNILYVDISLYTWEAKLNNNRKCTEKIFNRINDTMTLSIHVSMNEEITRMRYREYF